MSRPNATAAAPCSAATPSPSCSCTPLKSAPSLAPKCCAFAPSSGVCVSLLGAMLATDDGERVCAEPAYTSTSVCLPGTCASTPAPGPPVPRALLSPPGRAALIVVHQNSVHHGGLEREKQPHPTTVEVAEIRSNLERASRPSCDDHHRRVPAV